MGDVVSKPLTFRCSREILLMTVGWEGSQEVWSRFRLSCRWIQSFLSPQVGSCTDQLSWVSPRPAPHSQDSVSIRTSKRWALLLLWFFPHRNTSGNGLVKSFLFIFYYFPWLNHHCYCETVLSHLTIGHPPPPSAWFHVVIGNLESRISVAIP